MKQYIETHKERFFDELFSLLRIPSISSSSEHKADMKACADRLVELLLEAGADKAEVCPTAGHPVVFGEKIVGPSGLLQLLQGEGQGEIVGEQGVGALGLELDHHVDFLLGAFLDVLQRGLWLHHRCEDRVFYRRNQG